MALLNGSRRFASVGGPTVGGLMVQVLRCAAKRCSAMRFSYLGSVVFLRRIEISQNRRSGTRKARPPGGLLAGLSFVIRRPIMRADAAFSVATVNLFTFALSSALIHHLVATTTLGVSPGALGLRTRDRVRSICWPVGTIFA